MKNLRLSEENTRRYVRQTGIEQRKGLVQMKNISFMVLADAHLDSDFSRDCNLRREEQRIAFDKAIDMVREYGLEFLLIPGDLFDKRCPDKETVAYVKKRLASVEGTKVIIAPGNHDPISNDSPYGDGSWPKNVYIFPSKKISMIEFGDKYRTKLADGRADSFLYRSDDGFDRSGKKGVRIYGAAFEGHFSRESLLSDENGGIPELSPSYINILLMHGEAGTSRSVYNPIPDDLLRACGFDFCALGHVHSYKKTDDYVYSGVLCSRGFDEQGDCGVVVGEITGDGRVLTEFMPLNVRKYVTAEIDITDEVDLSVDALGALILGGTDRSLCTHVVLKGTVPLNEKINTEALLMRLTGNYPQVKVSDCTAVAADWKLLSEEHSLRGIFVRRLLEKLRDSDDSKYTRENIEDALEAGIKAFGGNL